MHAAVVARQGSSKGEQIVLVSTFDGANRADLLTWIQNHGVAELAAPRQAFCTSREIPVLGTGKTDYPSVSRLVEASAYTS